MRPFNTYGPRQSARAVIPTIITQIASGKKQIKLGDPSPTRDFNFVEDCCRGFIELAENKKTIGETINIGSNTEIILPNLFYHCDIAIYILLQLLHCKLPRKL